MKIQIFTKQVRKVLPRKSCGAVIVAAGTASRMGGIDKVMAPLNGEPMIVRTVRTFQQSDVIDEIIVVTREDLIREIMGLCAGLSKVKAVVAGGRSRQESVLAGIYTLSKRMKLVAVHDGARPLVTWDVIDRAVRGANTYGAAVPGVAVKDTVKEIKGGIVANTPQRDKLRAIQTPQVFDVDLLRVALKKAQQEGTVVTDDSLAVENMGMSVKIVTGDERNMKVTTPMDLKLAQMLLEEEK